MAQFIRPWWFGLALAALFLVVWGFTRYWDHKAQTQVTYQLKLTPSQSVEFKSELRRFADQNEYEFIDGSAEMREGREYINREANAGLVTGEVMNVTLEPQKSGLGLFANAMTAARNEQDVRLLVVYDKRSPIERSMARDLSEFARKWSRLATTPSS